MPSMLGTASGHVIVAVNFDEDTESLRKTAIGLAMQFGTAIRFVHVIEGAIDAEMNIYGADSQAAPLMRRETRQELMASAQSKMKELVASLTLAVTVDGKVLEGPVADGIIAEAISSHANLIVCAARPKEYKHVPRGFSVALSLMHDAPLPVLIVGPNHFDATQERMRIMVADDLNEDSKNAVSKAYEFAAYCNESRVRHVHVHGDIREKFAHRWDELKDKVPFLKTEGATFDAALATDHDARQKAMRARGGLTLFAAENVGVTAELDIRVGDPVTEISRCAEEFLPALTVFGRHRFWRARPFLIGRIPMRTMLEGKSAVMVVPSVKEQITWSGFLR